VQIFRAALCAADAHALVTDLGIGATDMADILPEIRDLAPSLEPSAPLEDAAQARFRMFESIRQFIVGLNRDRAVLLVLDDLHWADTPSLRLLEFLAPEIAGGRLLLMGTYRANELSRQHPLSDALGGLARVRHATRIHLAGLTAEEVHEFIAAATGTRPPAWLASSLYTQTEGNPLFLREIVRFLEQQGVFSAPLSALPPAIRIPEGVKEVIGRRLNLLSAACNKMLALASVIGRNFALDVMQHATGRIGDDSLLDALDEGVAAHVIEETTEGRYQFTHNLIRMTLYDELRMAQRRGLHRAVGKAIEALHRADVDAFLPELARHFHVAGDIDRAIHYATRAGQRADALMAFEDAAQFFQTALDGIEQGEPDELARCRLLLLLGEAQRKVNDYPRALETLRGAAEVATALGEAELLARAALAYEHVAWRSALSGDPPSAYLLERAIRQLPRGHATLEAQLAGALARALIHAGAFTEARAQGARAITMARQLGEPAALATNLSYMFDSTWEPEHSEELIGYATEMLTAAEQAGNMEIVAVAYAWRLVFQLEFGNVNAAEADLDALTRIDERIRQPTYSIAMRSYHIMFALMRGDLAEAERRVIQSMALQRRGLTAHEGQLSIIIFTLRREQGRLAEFRPVLNMFLRQQPASATWVPGLALLYVEIGQLDDARLEFERLATDDFAAVARDGRWYFCMAYLSEVCAALGDAARASVLYRMLQPYADRNLVLGGGLVCCGSADRYLGLLCTTMSRWAEAQDHFEAALVMNSRIGAHAPLAHTRHDYAAMVLARGRPGDRQHAMALLQQSLESARAFGMRALEERVAARLAQLPGPQPATAAIDELTSREIEVLGLMAIGRSNADIAMVLAISLNTVATHVRNILAKTGCANRTEAAAYAMRHRLAGVAHQA
jgi:DNA-binding NarL/FixJ family response regulator